MIGALGSALSGINAYQTVMDVAGKNVSNMASEGYKADRVEMTPTRTGVTTSVTTDQSPGAQVVMETEAGQDVVEMSNVNLAKEMVNMMVGQRGVEANVATVKASDEMLGTLLDMLG